MPIRQLFPHACGLCRTTVFLGAALVAAVAMARDSDGLWPAGVAAELEALLLPTEPEGPTPAPAAAADTAEPADGSGGSAQNPVATHLTAEETAAMMGGLFTRRLSRPSTPVTLAPGVAEPGLAASMVQAGTLRELERVIEVFEANPLLRGTLRHALHDDDASAATALPPLGNQDPGLLAPPPGDARLELCPVWGRVRGAMVRLIF